MPSALQLISSGGYYGAERVLVELGVYLKGQGWGSHVGVFETPGEAGDAVAREAEAHGLSVVRFPCAGKFDRGTARAIAEYCCEHRIDIAHSHNFKPDVHLRYAKLPEPTRRVATCHSWISENWKLRLYEWIDRRALRHFDHVVVVAPALRAKVLAGGVEPGRATMIENGIAAVPPLDERERMGIRAEIGAASEQPLIVCVCRLSAEKCVGLLIRSFAALHGLAGARLVIVGDGCERAQLEAEAARLGQREKVIFTGYRSDARRIIAASDLFVISSNTEGLPISLLEAMSAGLPILSTSVGAIPMVIRHGENGLLVEHSSMGGLAEGLRELLDDPDKARQLGAAARADYELNHSDTVMGGKYLRIYHSVMQEERRR